MSDYSNDFELLRDLIILSKDTLLTSVGVELYLYKLNCIERDYEELLNKRGSNAEDSR